MLSCRPGLLAADPDPALHAANVAVGRWGRGVVYDVKPSHALVRFFGGLTGHCFASRCSVSKASDATKVLSVGQVVRARVVSLHRENPKRVEISLVASDHDEALAHYRPAFGETVTGRVVTIVEGKGFELELVAPDGQRK